MEQSSGRTESGARASAMRLLVAREHTVIELTRKLISRGYDRLQIKDVIDELSVEGLQSDRRFTEVYVRSRVGKGYGPAHISRSLREKGIDDELINEYLKSTDDYWLSIAKEILDKRFPSQTVLTDKDWHRRARFLSSRGFSGATVYKALPEKQWD